MNLLVTGGLGFIGSNFIRYILDKYPHYRIVNLDVVNYCANFDNLRDIEDNHRYKFVKGDICDAKKIGKVIQGRDIIINFAAQTHVDRSIKDSKEFIRTNVFGTQVLLDVAKRYKIRRFVQISTDEVYGSTAKGHFSEDSALAPNSPYAASKAAADLLARSYFVTHKLPVIIIRSSNNFGPYQYPEKITPLFITNALLNKKVPLYADGSNIREWLYVLDNCDAIDFILKFGKAGEIYNIGSGNELKNIDLTRKILNMLGKDKSLIKFVKDRPGHDKRYALNFEKLKRLGWKPKYKFEDALRETVLWYKENTKWWKRLKKREKCEKFC